MMTSNPINLTICHNGIRLLKNNEVKPFDQRTIAKELKKIGHKVGESTITKILQYNPEKGEGKTVRLTTLKRVADGCTEIDKSRIGYGN